MTIMYYLKSCCQHYQIGARHETDGQNPLNMLGFKGFCQNMPPQMPRKVSVSCLARNCFG
jgi:hypothetical protein